MSGGHGVCIVDGSGVVVKRVRGEDRVIELGGGVWPAKSKYECGALVISPVKKSFTGGAV